MIFFDSRLSRFTFFSCLFFAFFACTKITNTDIGAGLIPPVDGVKTKDTVLEVITKNESFDTVAVGFSDDHVLGYTNDPVFGITAATINFQVGLPYSSLSFGAEKSTLDLDSVVLSLKYKGVWGDSLPHLALHVYEMDPENKFTVDSSYKSTVSFEKGSELTENSIANIDITKLNDPDTLKQYDEDATGQIRIRLTQAFGEKLLNQFDSVNEYQNDSTFHNYFRGFIVEPEPTGNALMLVSLSDTSTRLSLYYHYTNSSGGVDTAIRRFSTSALSGASSNTIKRNYQGTNITDYFPTNNNVQDSLLFIQTSPGTYARLKVPGLTGLQNMIVHRAEFLMQQVPDISGISDNIFTAPNLFLAAYSKDSGRRFAVPLDVQFSSGVIGNLTSFGVLPIKKTDKITGKTISAYSFDISRYTQSIITRNDTLHDFILWAPYNYYITPIENTPYAYPISTPALNAAAIGRVRLGGGNNSQYKMRLHIVYSPL